MSEESKLLSPVSDKVKKLLASSSPETIALFHKQEEFTLPEATGLAFWLEAVLRGKFELAKQIRDSFLRFEHWRSLLAPKISDVPDDALLILTQLAKEFEESIKDFVKKTRPNTDPDVPKYPRER